MIIEKSQGFTLIELSIVLVIIGILAGGVLLGRDLIHAAETRATITQIEKLNAAVNTFRGKYGGLPGDLPARLAEQFGMETRSGAKGQGDGNQALEPCGTANHTRAAGCETVLFMRDLSAAGLVNGTYNTATNIIAQIPAGDQGKYYEQAKLGKGNYIVPYYSISRAHHRYSITRLLSTDATGAFSLADGLTPTDLYSIDSKIDDGLPMSGSIYFTNRFNDLNSALIAGGATNFCGVEKILLGGDYIYNLQYEPDSLICQLNARAQW